MKLLMPSSKRRYAWISLLFDASVSYITDNGKPASLHCRQSYGRYLGRWMSVCQLQTLACTDALCAPWPRARINSLPIRRLLSGDRANIRADVVSQPATKSKWSVGSVLFGPQRHLVPVWRVRWRCDERTINWRYRRCWRTPLLTGGPRRCLLSAENRARSRW